MNTATHLSHDTSLAFPALASPRGRHLGLWLAALRSSLRTEARPAASTVSTSALDKGRTLWVDQPMARVVSCLEGTLWLTFDGVRNDIILAAGESYRCDSASRLAIHALDAARFDMA
jgi:hypothetical protein